MTLPFDDLDEDDREAALSILRVEIARRRRRAAAIETVVRTEKKCPACATVKAASEFGRNAARADGLQSLCRACR